MNFGSTSSCATSEPAIASRNSAEPLSPLSRACEPSARPSPCSFNWRNTSRRIAFQRVCDAAWQDPAPLEQTVFPFREGSRRHPAVDAAPLRARQRFDLRVRRALHLTRRSLLEVVQLVNE